MGEILLLIRVDNGYFDINGALNRYADYIVVVCTNCSEQYVHDEEHCVLYYDPEDHSKNFLSVFSANEEPQYYPIPCKGCRKVDWNFIELTERELAKLGPWGKYIRGW
ncbi:hypothetical protein HQN89_36735 [Paenibacillus frigoriresistens]|nr:hypothetical protein [Paenibacillus frigoriresistens]